MAVSTDLSLVEAAERLGVEVEDVFDLIVRREIRFSQLPSGRFQVPVDALDEYLAGSGATST